MELRHISSHDELHNRSDFLKQRRVGSMGQQYASCLIRNHAEHPQPEHAGISAGTGVIVGAGLGWFMCMGNSTTATLGPALTEAVIEASFAIATVGGSVGGALGILWDMSQSRHERV